MRAEFAPANAKLYNGRYRPMFYHSVRAGLDASGKLLAWRHRLAGQSFILGTPLEVDVTAVKALSTCLMRSPTFRLIGAMRRRRSRPCGGDLWGIPIQRMPSRS